LFYSRRDPERLALKYAKMAQSPFIFLRGACHLCYDHLPDSRLFSDAATEMTLLTQQQWRLFTEVWSSRQSAQTTS